MKAFTCNIIALLALVTTNAVAAPATVSDSVDLAVETTAGSTSELSTLGEESVDEDYDDDEPFNLSELLPELFPELVARAKPGCMGGTWRACHDWTVRQCPLRCTGLPRRRHPCTQRCIRGADIQCQKACS
ncbi:hypothetical protein ISF_01182 [Cordyceps fumosorosea ARSEF 2679]|uniref:Uncharacterized protein n=1 Tax=Cordyceps fumosorosea (strain ARSEF 2679) TaxID=1081104 RepID=A0A162MXD0_CORFA|nr:hypothetical protein ISF_01182 [Cordyceps fumosorosea ARSEF 2679]OAA72109.1 hypothetical protein ISF_01182 [Cordyceps fumosorosea ARSEF 2679]